MTHRLLGKFSAQPGSRDELVTYRLRAAKLLQEARPLVAEMSDQAQFAVQGGKGLLG